MKTRKKKKKISRNENIRRNDVRKITINNTRSSIPLSGVSYIIPTFSSIETKLLEGTWLEPWIPHFSTLNCVILVTRLLDQNKNKIFNQFI
jgi:hypothetical protein